MISKRLASAGVTKFKDSDISYALHEPYASGDPELAFSLMMLYKESEEGIIRPYNSNVKMLGAVNRENSTCYLDSLLFAMFARLGCFEAMLYMDFEDGKKKQLATLLRLWINTLRSGKLITADIVRTKACWRISRTYPYLDKTHSARHCRLWMGGGSPGPAARRLGSLQFHHRHP